MHIAIIGTGSLGTALGTRLSERHRVTFGSRDPGSDAARQLDEVLGKRADVRLIPEAVADAEGVVLATPWPVTEALVRTLDLAGKVVIDATNDVGPDFLPEASGPESCAERIARLASGARVVKAFCSTGAGNLQDPNFGPVRPVMPFCGDDADAKRTVARLIEGVGFEAADAGPLVAARQLEALALLWIRLAHTGYGPTIAFALVTR